ncbi:MAG: ribulose-phosphate 3-epimerase [Puniceicoccales bacterium]|jgi:ribulose-phosphate 3-epimerase|nr:ribulose-phosphate 3-epimerase [Puniceicoccales bacterium]
MVNTILAPSILAYDNCDLLTAVKIIENSGAQWIHVDVMDGHFVDNVSFGPKLVADLRRHSDLFLDVHLMLDRPDRHIVPFVQAGADALTIHREVTCDVGGLLGAIRDHGCLCGLAFNPETALDFELVRLADVVLLMGVHPGFCGQNFIAETWHKILQLHNFRNGNKLSHKISVDGGVREDIAKNLICAGVDIIISGSAFFSNPSAFKFCLN